MGNWRVYDDQYVRGEITLQECLRKQGALVHTPEMVITAELERVTSFRPNFGKLVTYCRSMKIPLIIVSAGLDFAIRHLLRMKSWDSLVKLYVAKSETTPGGIKFTFPRLQDKASLSIKDDVVKRQRKQGRKVVYVGDGVWDIHALRAADYRFVIKSSRLAALCREQNIPAREITDFQELVYSIEYDMSP